MSYSASPNLTDFTAFLRSEAGIDPLYLPDNSPTIGYAFDIATSTVHTALAGLPGNLYAIAIYNFGTDSIVNFAPDQPGRTYFLDLRTSLGINTFVPGVISSSSNSPTSQSTLNPEFMKNLTFGDLQLMKTSFGRTYLNLAQSYGAPWGVS